MILGTYHKILRGNFVSLYYTGLFSSWRVFRLHGKGSWELEGQLANSGLSQSSLLPGHFHSSILKYLLNNLSVHSLGSIYYLLKWELRMMCDRVLPNYVPFSWPPHSLKLKLSKSRCSILGTTETPPRLRHFVRCDSWCSGLNLRCVPIPGPGASFECLFLSSPWHSLGSCGTCITRPRLSA